METQSYYNKYSEYLKKNMEQRFINFPSIFQSLVQTGLMAVDAPSVRKSAPDLKAFPIKKLSHSS